MKLLDVLNCLNGNCLIGVYLLRKNGFASYVFFGKANDTPISLRDKYILHMTIDLMPQHDQRGRKFEEPALLVEVM